MVDHEIFNSMSPYSTSRVMGSPSQKNWLTSVLAYLMCRIAQQHIYDEKELGIAVCYGCGYMLWKVPTPCE